MAERVSRRMRNDEMLVTSFGATRLRMELDKIPLWRGDHVPVRQLIDDFARYVYLPRLTGPPVLLEAMRNGLSLMTWEQDSFAYADSYDEPTCRYRGIHHGPRAALSDSDTGLLIRPEVALGQLSTEIPSDEPPSPDESEGSYILKPRKPDEVQDPPITPPDPEPATPPRKARRYHGSVELDSTRIGRDASQIADEVMSHLSGLLGANVRVTLDIEAHIPDGAPDHVVRTVTENSRTLKFDDSGFEEE